jgi:hypothetical protein
MVPRSPDRRHSPRDTPAPVGAIRSFTGLNILAGNQRQQSHRLGASGVQIPITEPIEQPRRIPDHSVNQLRTRLRVVPGDRRVTRVGIIIGSTPLGDHLGITRHFAAHSADRRDQLNHGVLGGHRVGSPPICT